MLDNRIRNIFHEMIGKFYLVLLWEAYTKVMTLYRESNRTYVYSGFVSTLSLHEWFIEQACKSEFITDLDNT